MISRFLKKKPLPNLIIIGAQKSATRWLRDTLNEHPDIFMAPRELEFFNHHYEKGLAWYSEKFKEANKCKVIGEATPGYMMFVDNPERSAERIHKDLPDVRLIALLRDPVERLISAYVHHIRMGRLKPDASLMQLVRRIDPEKDKLGLVSGGWYARSLEPYIKLFGDRLFIEMHENVKDDPRTLYENTLKHLNIDNSFYPQDLQKVRYSNREEVGAKALEAARLTADQKKNLYNKFFAADTTQLEDLAGLDFSLWKKKYTK